MRTTTRAVSAAGALCMSLLGGTPPASATVVPTPMWVHVLGFATTHEVCVHGEASAPDARWELLVEGVRLYDYAERRSPTTADLSDTVIDQRATYATRLLHTCMTVTHDGADTGTFLATLTYTGSKGDLVGVLAGVGYWTAGRSDGTSVGVD